MASCVLASNDPGVAFLAAALPSPGAARVSAPKYVAARSGSSRVSASSRNAPCETISLPRYLGFNDAAARRVTEASPAERDTAILDYFKSRKLMGEVIHRFFGDPGLKEAVRRTDRFLFEMFPEFDDRRFESKAIPESIM